MEIVCFTTFTMRTVAQARVLAETIRKHHPDWRLIGALVDASDPGPAHDPNPSPFDDILLAHDILASRPDAARPDGALQLHAAVRALLLLQLSEATGADAVIHLAADTVLFKPLTGVEELLQHNAIVLVPRVTDADAPQNKFGLGGVASLPSGVYDPGFIAVRTGGEGLRFARWWTEQLLTTGADDAGVGQTVGLRWCDQAPALFDQVHILRHRGYNVSNFNLATRRVALDCQGELCVDDSPLYSWRFAELGDDGTALIVPYDGRNHLVREVCVWYQRALDEQMAEAELIKSIQ